MPVLSLCLIARDEEKLLADCLQSVKGVVDELVVVDTGSTDRTIAIARAAGAHVYQHAWQDDFSVARNQALAHATGEWVLILDADERLAPGAGTALCAAIRSAAFDCGMLRLHNASHPEASANDVLGGAARVGEPLLLPRLIRRTSDLSFRGAIHENIDEWLIARGRQVSLVDADILHFGAMPDLRLQRRKRERNLRLLREQCEREPGNTTAFGYLSFELLELGELASAREVAERGWRLVLQQPPRRSVLRLAAARAIGALRAAEPGVVLETVNAAEIREGGHADLFFLKGCALEMLALRAAQGSVERAQLLEEAMNAQQSALSHRDAIELHRYIAGAASWAASIRVGALELMAHRPAAALETFEHLRADPPQDAQAVLGKAEALLDLGHAFAAMQLLETALDHRPDGWLLAAAAAASIGSLTDARALFSRAAERAGTGYRSPHRRERHDALVRSLNVGADTDSVVAALLARKSIPSRVTIDAQSLAQSIRQLVQSGRAELLIPLLEPRAETACPGIGQKVRALLAEMGLSVEDDGEPVPVFFGSFDAADLDFLQTGLHAHSRLAMGARPLQWLSSGPMLQMAPTTGALPGAKFVHVVRDGRAIAARSSSPVQAAGEWAAATESLRSRGAALRDQYLELRYEDILADPVTQLDRVFAFLGEAYETSSARALNAAYPGRPDAWRQTLSGEALASVEATAGACLRSLGYGGHP